MHTPIPVTPAPATALPVLPAQQATAALEQIIVRLHEHSGQDFSHYKTNILLRRIERRLMITRQPDLACYQQFLRSNPQETGLLYRELLIGVTWFFRDPGVWASLAKLALPPLLARAGTTDAGLRIWIPACSTGEEAYSLAMLFAEQPSMADPPCQVKIFATDLNDAAIQYARQGLYTQRQVSSLSPERLARHFEAHKHGWRIKRQIREMIIFSRHNLLVDPPISQLDLLLCRNLLIYFKPLVQQKLLPLFHYALKSGGMLLLGKSESVGDFDHLFSPIDREARLFLHKPQAIRRDQLPTVFTHNQRPLQTAVSNDLNPLVASLLQQHLSMAVLLVTADGNILHYWGQVEKYLINPAGLLDLNVEVLLRDGLRQVLLPLIAEAAAGGLRLELQTVGNEHGQNAVPIQLLIQGLTAHDRSAAQVLIICSEHPGLLPGHTIGRHEHPQLLRQELQRTRLALEESRQNLCHAQEDSKSLQEEQQTITEGLQAGNEDLSASKEELLSVNEELQTVNRDQQAKIDNLLWLHNDMQNLLNIAGVIAIILDRGMKLRHFTQAATRLFKLIDHDIGRPLSHIVSSLNYPALEADALRVLQTLCFSERIVQTREAEEYRLRIQPYRREDQQIDGVVISLNKIDNKQRLRMQWHHR